MRLVGANIAIERGGRRLFSDLSFAAAAGEALIVTGPNGAGKSSLLRAIAGLLRVAAGAVVLEGGDDELRLGEQAHYLGHADALKGALTARENLEFWAAMLGAEKTPADARTGPMPIGAALDRLGLAHVVDFPVNFLSAGQRRRVALARLLVAYRPLWLLDEPTSALDAAAQARLGEIMRAHLAGGGMIVAATHAPLGLDGRELKLGAQELIGS
ncbi:heme ABC exporter ATP-binding protein CcmA [Methylocapsa sp. S129]|uniref:heme ABC exporter ATP-binding protein CcmA n=1 Tax=Methylocapsa sp. S129 TaxID=1641869 RepID=UPI00131C1FA9|nr:heme ABC exporter ATP-binding protein CcmA [Methylocapsa sp. S129]